MTGTPWRTEPNNPVDDITAVLEEMRRPRTEEELDDEWAGRRDRDIRAAWALFKGGWPCASFVDMLERLSGLSGWVVDDSDPTRVAVTFPPRRKAKP